MVYGIDVSTYQRTLDMDAVRGAGNEFVGVKAVASYLPQLTVADDYHTNVDRVMAAGLPKYHYAVPNSQNTPEATAQFQWDIRYRHEPSDLFMLDNEPLNAYGVFWGDADCARYFNKLHSFGVPYSKMILYCPASRTRAAGYWSQIVGLRKLGLVIQWVSYGDMDALYESGETPDTTGTGLDDPEMHQFTSSYRIPGYDGFIDRVYSRLTLQELFGGQMTLEADMRDYAAGHLSPSDAPTWDQMCGSLMFRFNSWRGWRTQPNKSIATATIVGDNSGWLNPTYEKAPAGAWHFFSIPGVPAGHVMQDAAGGGWRCFSTGYTLGERLGNALGFVSVRAYFEAKNATYRGWATNYAGGTIDVAAPAATATTPIGGGATKITNGANQMSSLIARIDKDGSCYVWNLETGAVQHIPDTYQLGVLQRFLPTTSFAEQNQFAAFRNWYGKTLSTAAAPAQVVVDTAKIAADVSAKVVAAVVEQGVQVDGDAIAAKVEAALADNFATIPQAVVDEIAS